MCFRLFYIARAYASAKKWTEAIALYQRTLDYAKTAIEGYKKLKTKDAQYQVCLFFLNYKVLSKYPSNKIITLELSYFQKKKKKAPLCSKFSSVNESHCVFAVSLCVCVYNSSSAFKSLWSCCLNLKPIHSDKVNHPQLFCGNPKALPPTTMSGVRALWAGQC